MSALNSSVHMETAHVSELKSPGVGGLRSCHSPSVALRRSRNLHALIYKKGVSLSRVSVCPVQYKHSRDLFRQKSPRGRQSQTKESARLHSEHCEGPTRSRHHRPWPPGESPAVFLLFRSYKKSVRCLIIILKLQGLVIWPSQRFGIWISGTWS